MTDSAMDFESWFEDVCQLAYERSGRVGRLVSRAPFMYEDYFEEGLSPEAALVQEWGE